MAPSAGASTSTAVGELGPAAREARAAGLQRWRRHGWPLLLIAPFFLAFAVFQLYPIGFAVWLSFRDWTFGGQSRWVGLANFRAAFHDTFFTQSLVNVCLIFLIYVPLMILIAAVLAALLNSNYVRLQGVWRTIVFLPYVMSGTIAVAYTFQLLLSSDAGYANKLLSFISVSPVPWLSDGNWARVSIGIVVLWSGLGYNMLLLLAGLQAIPKELSEAARVDGAGPVRIFFRITVPLLRPVLLFVFTLSIIATAQLWVEPFIITGGGPANATTSPVLQIYNNTFLFGRVGYGAAESMILLLLIVIVAVTQFFLLSRGDFQREQTA